MHFLSQTNPGKSVAHQATLVAPNTAIVIATGLILVSGCSSSTAMRNEPVAPKVIVAPAISRTITDFDEFVGRTDAAQYVEVRSRLSGYLQTIEFEDGAMVTEGQLLATIQPDEFKAIHEQSKARIKLWEAKLELARSKLRRSDVLIKTAAISQEEYDESDAGVKEAEAALVAAKADAARTELDVNYTEIKSPIEGRIDRALVTPGNMLTGGLGSGTLITRIVSISPIYAYLDVDEASILRYIRKVRNTSGGIDEKERAALRAMETPCYLQLNDEQEAQHVGVLDFVENQIDKSTGTIRLRAEFKNEQRILRSGMFVRARIPVSDPYDAVLIPETAIGTDLTSKYAFVINADNKAERRNLTLGAAQGTYRIIRDGIQAGERVVVRGIQRVNQGSLVDPVEDSPSQSTSDSKSETGPSKYLNGEGVAK
jgi:RND family efflux transporter MFP subunit